MRNAIFLRKLHVLAAGLLLGLVGAQTASASLVMTNWLGYTNQGSLGSPTNFARTAITNSLFPNLQTNLLLNGGFEFGSQVTETTITFYSNTRFIPAVFLNPHATNVTGPNGTTGVTGPSTNLPSWSTIAPTNGQPVWGGPVGNYMMWGGGRATGSVGVTGTRVTNFANRLVGSDPIPQGSNAVYFGMAAINLQRGVPRFTPQGLVTNFQPVTTVYTNGGVGGTNAPARLAQTVTGLSTSSVYSFSFWASGEDVNAIAKDYGNRDGVFGLSVSGENFSTAPGYSNAFTTLNSTQILLLAVPSGMATFNTTNSAGLGTNGYYYQFIFKPSTSTVTFTWYNWGHTWQGTNRPGVFTGYNGASPNLLLTTELVLDDITLVQIPEPGAAVALAALVAGGWVSRRRRARLSFPAPKA